MDGKGSVLTSHGNRGNLNMTIINEFGLYSLILSSRAHFSKRKLRVLPPQDNVPGHIGIFPWLSIFCKRKRGNASRAASPSCSDRAWPGQTMV